MCAILGMDKIESYFQQTQECLVQGIPVLQ